MKKFIIPLVTAVAVVSIILAGCVPEAAPPVTPPVTPPPVVPPPVVPPPVTPQVGCAPPARTPPGGATSWVGSYDPETFTWEPVVISTRTGPPTAEPEGIWDGFAVKPDGTPYRFHWQISTTECEWCAACYGMAESYFTRAGAEVNLFGSKFNPQMELSIIDDAMVRGDIDAVMLLPVETVGMIPKVEEMADKGIPCFNWSVLIPGPAPVSGSGLDYVKAGEMSGRAVAEYAEARGEPITVYWIWGSIGQTSSIEMTQGFHNILDPHPLVTVVESPPCDWVPANATNAIIDTFSVHPEWNAISEMGAMISGIIEGLRTIDRLYPIGDPRHVFVGSQGGEPSTMQYFEDSLLDSCVLRDPWDETDCCIKSIFHYVILGQPVARMYELPVYNLTPADTDNPMLWGNLVRWGVPYDDWPVLHQPDIIETPTLAMRMELCGY